MASARLHRRFGCPSNLDPHEQVLLALEWEGTIGEVRLNGRVMPCPVTNPPAGNCDPMARAVSGMIFDVTSLLDARNMLVVELIPAASRTEKSLLFDARLEIRG